MIQTQRNLFYAFRRFVILIHILTRRKMIKGKVKWFNFKKGYGFIQPEDGSKDVFVHKTALKSSGIDNLEEGQDITFEIAEENGKNSAVNLKI